MEQKIKALISELKEQTKNPLKSWDSMEDSDAKINVWYVIAKLEEALLEGKNGQLRQ